MEKYNFSEQIIPLLEILSICSNIKKHVLYLSLSTKYLLFNESHKEEL